MESLDNQKQEVKAFRVEGNVRQTVTKAHLMQYVQDLPVSK